MNKTPLPLEPGCHCVHCVEAAEYQRQCQKWLVIEVLVGLMLVALAAAFIYGR